MICIIIRVSGHHDILLSEYLDIVATWTAVPGLMAEHNIAAVNSKQCSCCNISLVEDPPILDGGEIAQNQDINAERIERKENIQHQFCDVAQFTTCHSLPRVIALLPMTASPHVAVQSRQFFQPTYLTTLPAPDGLHVDGAVVGPHVVHAGLLLQVSIVPQQLVHTLPNKYSYLAGQFVTTQTKLQFREVRHDNDYLIQKGVAKQGLINEKLSIVDS